MNERIKAFLASDEQMREEEKAAVLIKLGFSTREYEPDQPKSGSDKEYPLYDVTKGRHYKLVPVEMDDETYRKVLNTRKAQSILTDSREKQRISAVCYRLAGCLIAIGIPGTVLSVLMSEFIAALIVFSASVIETTVLIAFGKIIGELNKYRNL